jgi:glyoxylate reductase
MGASLTETRLRCLVTRELPGPALDRLRSVHDVTVWPERLPPSPHGLHALVADRDPHGLLCLLTDRIDAPLLDVAPHLRILSNYAVGVDNIDLSAAQQRGVRVGNTPDVLTESTAELAFALMLALARRLPEAQTAVRRGDWLTWEPGQLLGRDLYGATLGIVGPGRIGEALARRAEGFSMTVLRSGRSGPIPFEELLERSDFVSLHCPLTAATRNLIDAGALARMKPSAYLVNAARGGIVDQAALAAALADGTIAGAALDVTDPEPLSADDPLLRAPNLIVVPHIGSATHATRERMAEIAVDNLLAGLTGAPLRHEVLGTVPAPASAGPYES